MEIEILQEERLRDWCAQIDLPAAAVDELAEVAQAVRADAVLGAIFAAFHEKTAVRGEWHREWSALPVDPAVEAALGQRSALFYLLAYLAALPYTRREYQRRGIDLSIMYATLSDIRIWLVHEFDLSGVWTFRQFMWIWRHLACELFRLGRMQFTLVPFEWGARAFRRRGGDEVCLLANPDLPLRADGYAFHAGRTQPGDPYYHPGWQPPEPQTEWHASFETRADGWQGNLVSPYGCVAKATLFLPSAQWELILQAGDTVLELHIPRKDPFTQAACRESLCQAYEFFATYFPERPFKAACCHTWFFTPQLQQILPVESNIVRFQREFNLIPIPGSPAFLWNYVFGEKVASLAQAPRDTALRRAVLNWLENGGELFDLAGVMFHDPQAWGSQPGMRRWDARAQSAA